MPGIFGVLVETLEACEVWRWGSKEEGEKSMRMGTGIQMLGVTGVKWPHASSVTIANSLDWRVVRRVNGYHIWHQAISVVTTLRLNPVLH